MPREASTPPGTRSGGRGPSQAPDTLDRTYPYTGPKVLHITLMLLIVLAPFGVLAWAFVQGWAGFGLRELFLMVGTHFLVVMGITLGYHRMTAHVAFRARAPVRAVLLGIAGLALQGGPATWAATHRRHHAVADKEGDPHSPLEGLWHAHFGWLPKGRLVTKGPAYEKLMQDPIIRFFERTQLLWNTLSVVAPGLVALLFWGPAAFVPALLWAGVVRVALVHHTTWAVNSLGHIWGTRPYDSPDQSRNNGVLAFLSGGEGWHNNHHHAPRSAYIGHRWYQVDFGKYAVWTMAKLRLVSDVVRPPARESGRRRRRQTA